MSDKRTVGYYLGLFAKGALAVAMLLYLGMHSYNFFTFTFKGDQWIFSVLGLFTTSIGFILWLVIYLYAAEEGLERAVSLIMMFVSLMGEFAVAAFDMYMNIAGAFDKMAFTPEDLRNLSYLVAGLALLNGLALVAGVAGQQIMDDMSNVKFPSFRKKSNASVTNNVTSPANVPALTVPQPAPMLVNASETEQVTLSPAPAVEAGQKEHPFRANGQ